MLKIDRKERAAIYERNEGESWNRRQGARCKNGDLRPKRARIRWMARHPSHSCERRTRSMESPSSRWTTHWKEDSRPHRYEARTPVARPPGCTMEATRVPWWRSGSGRKWWHHRPANENWLPHFCPEILNAEPLPRVQMFYGKVLYGKRARNKMSIFALQDSYLPYPKEGSEMFSYS